MLDLDVRASPRCFESLFLTLLVRNLIGSIPNCQPPLPGGGILGELIRTRGRDKNDQAYEESC